MVGSARLDDTVDSDQLITLFDITEHKAFAQELQRHRDHLEDMVQQQTTKLMASETLWRFAIEGSGDGVWTGISPVIHSSCLTAGKKC